jgi:ComF family protein
LENFGYGETVACQDCSRFEPAFSGLRSGFVYRDVAREAVLSLKFEGVSAIAPRMASLMANVLADWSPPVETMVPVPLGWMRRRTRGYNQSELLAGEISRITELPVERHALRRRRQTSPQARQRDAVSRRENMRAAFEAGPRPASGSVLLIDDVATTGATLDACARVLLEAGASEVYALTFARED